MREVSDERERGRKRVERGRHREREMVRRAEMGRQMKIDEARKGKGDAQMV